MRKEEIEQLAREIREIEDLIAKGKQAQDPETCWGVYLLSCCLASRRKELREAALES